MAGALLKAQTVAVSPPNESVVTGGTKQYSVTVTGLTNNMVTWSVNGMPGGGGMYGSISASGLFSAPPAVPGNPAVTVRRPALSTRWSPKTP